VIDVRDDLLTLAIAYDETLLVQVREIRGRRWDSSAKVWTFPLTAIRSLRSLARSHGIPTSLEVDALPDIESLERPSVGVMGGRFTIRFEYDQELVTRVREIPGSRWDSRLRVWTVIIDSETEVARFIVDTDANIETSADDHLEEARESLAKIDASMAAVGEVNVPGLSGDLLPFQRAGVAYALEAMGR
jgi:hypothetical protein